MDTENNTSRKYAEFMEMCPPGSWWANEDGEILIQLISENNFLIETPKLINFKFNVFSTKL